MNDRELLELAAKAAGYKVDEAKKVTVYEEQNWLPMVFPQGNVPNLWNPLIDDSDALRLAVELGIDIGYGVANSRWALHFAGTKVFNESCEINGRQDPYAATRRAIVRAAADIGKQMGEQQ